MDRILHRNTAFVLAGVFLFAFWGFWPTYFSHPLTQASWRFHFHAITMISWCALMVTQAHLIRANKRLVHRQVGKLSFVLAPLVVITTLSLTHYRLRSDEFSDVLLYALALPMGLLLQFALAYGLAIYHRRNPVIHARYMICTGFPMIPPIFDRILEVYLLPPPQAQFVPQIGGNPLYPLITYSASDLALILLSVWDWRFRRRLNVFPVVLCGFVVFQGLTFVLHHVSFWRSFAEWFLSLPIS